MIILPQLEKALLQFICNVSAMPPNLYLNIAMQNACDLDSHCSSVAIVCMPNRASHDLSCILATEKTAAQIDLPPPEFAGPARLEILDLMFIAYHIKLLESRFSLSCCVLPLHTIVHRTDTCRSLGELIRAYITERAPKKIVWGINLGIGP